MKVLAVYSIKGGVGKTSSAVNLAYNAAANGYRTLVWDLDPQGASSYYFRIKPKVKGGSKGLVKKKCDLDDLIKGTDYANLDLLPADFSFRNLDLVLDNQKKPTKELKKLLKPLADDYDYVFLDCPPNISLLSEAVFAAADVILSPMIPTTLSLRTLEQLKEFFKNKELESLLLLPFFSMVDRRKKMHLDLMTSLHQQHAEILNTSIPSASDVERMGLERKPVADFSKNSPATLAYEALWAEILAQI